MTDDNNLAKTKALVGALLRMPPKPHSEMKLGNKQSKRGKPKRRTTKTPENREPVNKSAKPKR